MTNKAMKVDGDGTAFLIERLAADCVPLQYVRELTENSIQAIQARRKTGWTGTGEVIWDVDWHLVEKEGVYKLEVSDNGTGMTGPDIERFINHLAASGRVQDLHKNFGLGAKITACVLNPDGLIYKSWVDGAGVLAILCKDNSGYGLRQLEMPEGGFGYYNSLDDKAKSPPIDTCGTAVTLMGKDRKDDTFMPPGAPNKWLIKHLNDRYFVFPENITVQVRNFQKNDRAGWPTRRNQKMGEESGSQMRTIQGMRHFLCENAKQWGVQSLKEAKVHWWIFPKEGVSQGDIWESKAHCAAIYQRELYDFTKGRAGSARIREFGIPIGTSRVVLYVEPDLTTGDIMSDTARSSLRKGGNPLPWSEWANEFREKMPNEIKTMMEEEIASTASGDNSQSNKERLKEIQDLLKFANYRPSAIGNQHVTPSTPGGSPGDQDQSGHRGSSVGGGGGGRGGNPYADLARNGPELGTLVRNDPYPRVLWISESESSCQDEIKDRAAMYDEINNVLTMNKDFRGYRDLVNFFAKEFRMADDDSRIEIVVKKVQEILELQAVEVIYMMRTLKSEENWAGDPVKAALTPEALTAALSPRYAMTTTIRRNLAQSIGGRS
jgi:hypothetical protein